MDPKTQQAGYGLKPITVRYGRIPGYRAPERGAWGFEFSDENMLNCNLYTCSRPSARRLYHEYIARIAARDGYVITLVVDAGCGLDSSLNRIGR